MSDSGTPGTSTFTVSGDVYDRFMGRYSTKLAVPFADAAGIEPGHTAIDVGSGPGALTAELVRRLGAEHVAAVDPAPQFVDALRERLPGVDAKVGRAEELPFPDGRFDAALAQLVLHFVSDADATAREMRRVVRPGGIVAACVWDFGGGMRMLRLFWDAALATDPDAPDEERSRPLRPGRRDCGALRAGRARGRPARLARGRDLVRRLRRLLDAVPVDHGPAGAYIASLDEETRARFREQLREQMGSPAGPFPLTASAWYSTGRVP